MPNDPREVLREVEWSGPFRADGGGAGHTCPMCRAQRPGPHRPDCRLDAALSAPAASVDARRLEGLEEEVASHVWDAMYSFQLPGEDAFEPNPYKNPNWDHDPAEVARAKQAARRILSLPKIAAALAATPAPAAEGRLREALEIAESRCASAVAHVAAANYANRETEARKEVRAAFELLRAALTQEDRAQEDHTRLTPGQLPPAGKGGLCLLCATTWPAPCPQHRQTIQVLELDGPPPFPRAERFDERSGQWRLAGDPRPAPWWAFWRRRGHATREGEPYRPRRPHPGGPR